MKVLMIDDAKDMRRIVQYFFRAKHQIQVIEAATGREGIALAKSETPDLILLDLIMPEMSGEETLHALLSDPETKDIPVVLLTGREETEELDNLIKAGAKTWVTKMVPAPELIANIYKALQTYVTSP